MEESNLIRVDFRKDRLSIDFDPYFSGVKEIHCRVCSQRKPRNGAIEVAGSWGFFCGDCKSEMELLKSLRLQSRQLASHGPALYPAGKKR